MPLLLNFTYYRIVDNTISPYPLAQNYLDAVNNYLGTITYFMSYNPTGNQNTYQLQATFANTNGDMILPAQGVVAMGQFRDYFLSLAE